MANAVEARAALTSCLLASGGDTMAAVEAIKACTAKLTSPTMKAFSIKVYLEHVLAVQLDKALDADMAAIHTVLDLSLNCAAAGCVNLKCPIELLGDVLAAQTTDECTQTFDFIEGKKPFLLEKGFFTNIFAKNALLRLYNTVMLRLSRANDTVLRGRMLCFMATVLPVSDRSGVNLTSKFNVDNSTQFDDGTAAAAAPSEAGDAESMDVEGEGDDKTTTKADVEFYRKFWGIQAFFLDKTMDFGEETWTKLLADFEVIMDEFTSQSLVDAADADAAEEAKVKSAKGAKDSAAPTPRPAAAPAPSSFFAKFLTSPHLMKLQLRDPNFRRQMLTQLLIFLQSANATGTLSAKQRAVLVKCMSRAEVLLEKTATKGRRYVRSTKAMLKREENWVQWKDVGNGERCPSLCMKILIEQVPSTTKGKPRFLEMEGGDTIAELKAFIEHKIAIPPACQSLSIKPSAEGQDKSAKVLLDDDSKTLADYPALQSNVTVQVEKVKEAEPRPKFRTRTAPKRKAGEMDMGTAELTRLWNCGSAELAQLTEEDVPSLKKHLKPAIREAKEWDEATEEDRKDMDPDDFYKNDKLFLWRAQRLMAGDAVLFSKAYEEFKAGGDFDLVIKEVTKEEAATKAAAEGETGAGCGSATKMETS